MTCAALIVAAGRGTRAGGDRPKQWQPLAGARVIDWTLRAFQDLPEIQHIMIALHPDDIKDFSVPPGVHVTAGGATRAASVHAGLEALQEVGCTRVLIHDVARPCVSAALIRRRKRIAEDQISVAERAAIADLRETAATAAAEAARRLIAEKHDASADKAMVDRTIQQLGTSLH